MVGITFKSGDVVRNREGKEVTLRFSHTKETRFDADHRTYHDVLAYDFRGQTRYVYASGGHDLNSHHESDYDVLVLMNRQEESDPLRIIQENTDARWAARNRSKIVEHIRNLDGTDLRKLAIFLGMEEDPNTA